MVLTRGRWYFLQSTWLPLLQGLHDTVTILDLEETALQKAEEQEATAAKTSQSEGGEAVGPPKCGDVHLKQRELGGGVESIVLGRAAAPAERKRNQLQGSALC